MILDLRHIFKDYTQDKLVIPVLRMYLFRWTRANMWRSWVHPDPERPH